MACHNEQSAHTVIKGIVEESIKIKSVRKRTVRVRFRTESRQNSIYERPS